MAVFAILLGGGLTYYYYNRNKAGDFKLRDKFENPLYEGNTVAMQDNPLANPRSKSLLNVAKNRATTEDQIKNVLDNGGLSNGNYGIPLRQQSNITTAINQTQADTNTTLENPDKNLSDIMRAQLFGPDAVAEEIAKWFVAKLNDGGLRLLAKKRFQVT